MQRRIMSGKDQANANLLAVIKKARGHDSTKRKLDEIKKIVNNYIDPEYAIRHIQQILNTESDHENDSILRPSNVPVECTD